MRRSSRSGRRRRYAASAAAHPCGSTARNSTRAASGPCRWATGCGSAASSLRWNRRRQPRRSARAWIAGSTWKARRIRSPPDPRCLPWGHRSCCRRRARSCPGRPTGMSCVPARQHRRTHEAGRPRSSMPPRRKQRPAQRGNQGRKQGRKPRGKQRGKQRHHRDRCRNHHRRCPNRRHLHRCLHRCRIRRRNLRGNLRGNSTLAVIADDVPQGSVPAAAGPDEQPAGRSPELAELAAAFGRGAGLGAEVAPLTPEWMEHLGALMRATAEGPWRCCRAAPSRNARCAPRGRISRHARTTR